MDSRERVLRVLNHEEADRIPFIDFPWGETLERWYSEGLPRGVSLHDYFGYDIYLIGPDVSPKYDTIIIEENDKFRTYIDSWGVMVKAWIGRSGTPHPAGPPSVSTIEERALSMIKNIRSFLNWKRVNCRLSNKGEVACLKTGKTFL